MPIIFWDIETRSTVNLKVAGAHRYASDPATEILCIGYGVDSGPVNIWVPGQLIPELIIEAARDPSYLFTAHNDGFERTVERLILHPRFGWPLIGLGQRRCSMAMALAAALPGSLEGAAAALGIELHKNPEGAHAMKLMRSPRKPAKNEPPGIYWHDTRELRESLYRYCKGDVELERELYRRLPSLSESEQLVWQADAEINDRGFAVDLELAQAARELVRAEQKRIKDELTTLTNGKITSVHQHERIAALLREHGHNVAGIGKRSVAQVLARGNPCEVVRRVLELRKEGGGTGVTKLDAVFTKVDADRRARGTLRYHAAAPGRWSGSGIQPQNLPRVTIDSPDAAIVAVLSKNIEQVCKLGDPLEVISNTLRGIVRAAPGHVLLGGDFSSIESRIVAWFAGEDWKLANYREFDRTGDPELEPYCVTATRLLGRKVTPEDKVGRGVGKVGDLALGLGGGLGAWRKWDDTSSDEEANRHIATWRKAHPATVRFWHRLENAARTCVSTGCKTCVGRIRCHFENGTLYLMLPSGRRIAYPEARLGPGKFEGTQQVYFMDNAKGGWKETRAWHGTLTENVVQGTARDLLAGVILRLRGADFKIILHVHDEAVCEEPEDSDRTDSTGY
jgi:DNA polymerase